MSGEEAAAQSFYQTYFCDVLQHIFSVVTDTSHTAGKETDVMAAGTRVEMNFYLFKVPKLKTYNVLFDFEFAHICFQINLNFRKNKDWATCFLSYFVNM